MGLRQFRLDDLQDVLQKLDEVSVARIALLGGIVCLIRYHGVPNCTIFATLDDCMQGCEDCGRNTRALVSGNSSRKSEERLGRDLTCGGSVVRHPGLLCLFPSRSLQSASSRRYHVLTTVFEHIIDSTSRAGCLR